jgi:flagellar biosynthesis/type III secretory pathway M-ring protein FliF/YscJ
MSNQPHSNKPSVVPPVAGTKSQGINPKRPAVPQDPKASKEEQIKKLLAQMVDSDPAKMAEIIHQWLNEDKK